MFFLCRLLRDNYDYFSNLARNLNTVSLRQGKHSSDLIFLIHQNILYSSWFYNVDVLMPFTAISYNSFLSFINLRIYFCKLLCSAARAESLLKHLESTEEDGFTRPRRTVKASSSNLQNTLSKSQDEVERHKIAGSSKQELIVKKNKYLLLQRTWPTLARSIYIEPRLDLLFNLPIIFYSVLLYCLLYVFILFLYSLE